MFVPFSVPSGSFSTPLGSPKYNPPVSSLTTRRSTPSMTSPFNVEASIRDLNILTGRRFAKRAISFLSVSSALSGLIE